MNDVEYVSITLKIRHIFDLIRPISHGTQLDEAEIRSRAAIATLADVMESFLEAESREEERGRSSHRALNVEPSMN